LAISRRYNKNRRADSWYSGHAAAFLLRETMTNEIMTNQTMTNQGKDIKHPKVRGEWAEMRFMARAAEHGLVVTKPWGESTHYDFAVECEGRFLKVQVKSTMHRISKSYILKFHGSQQTPYAKGDFDFLAGYVIPLDVWYIIPAEAAMRGTGDLCVTPDSPKTRYEHYREAWHLLQGKPAEEERSSSTSRAVGSEMGGVVEDGNDPEGDAGDDAEAGKDAYSVVEARMRAIRWNPIHPYLKPRR